MLTKVSVYSKSTSGWQNTAQYLFLKPALMKHVKVKGHTMLISKVKDKVNGDRTAKAAFR